MSIQHCQTNAASDPGYANRGCLPSDDGSEGSDTSAPGTSTDPLEHWKPEHLNHCVTCRCLHSEYNSKDLFTKHGIPWYPPKRHQFAGEAYKPSNALC